MAAGHAPSGCGESLPRDFAVALRRKALVSMATEGAGVGGGQVWTGARARGGEGASVSGRARPRWLGWPKGADQAPC